MNSILLDRSNNKCELCESTEDLKPKNIAPYDDQEPDHCFVICDQCRAGLVILEQGQSEDQNYWRCLSKTMWTQERPVQIQIWRILHLLSDLDWARDLKEQIYLEEEVQKEAQAGLPQLEVHTLDSNGAHLATGDTVSLIKDLDVKGAGFTAKRGTVVKKIRLTDNPEHIEGKINGTQVVLVAKFLKKQK
jgi:protein PhnA